MPIYSAEYDSFPIDAHHVVDHFESAEADFLEDHFREVTVRIEYFDLQVIQIGLLGAPLFRVFHVQMNFSSFLFGRKDRFGLVQYRFSVKQRQSG